MHLAEWASKSFTAALALLGQGPSIDPDWISHDDFSKDVSKCGGYILRRVLESRHGLRADLELAGQACNAYGKDAKHLLLEVEYQTESRIHVHISDAAGAHHQIPEKFWPRPEGRSSSHDSELQFHWESHPFAFWITRRDSGDVIFDTRAANIQTHLSPLTNEHGEEIADSTLASFPLVFEDQYLQIATSLAADANIYGLGEVAASSGIRRDTDKGTIATLWNTDAGVPNDAGLYGSHPFYLATRDTPNSAHGVFLLNSHGMDVLLRPGALEYRVLGGTLDFYILAGPTPKDVMSQYAEVVGKPAKQAAWTFGFHLCRWDGEWVSIDRMRKVVETMKEKGIPMDTMWSDLDYMDRYRDFEPNDAFKKAYPEFLDWLHENGQHYVPIVDAGIGMPKNRHDKYQAYDKGHDLDLFIKDHAGDEFVGEVWPGRTVFPDFTHRHSFKWWADNFDHFHDMVKYDGIWLDMNEPASGTKSLDPPGSKWGFPPYGIHAYWGDLGNRTMAASARLADGSRHYDMHNIFGYLENMATRAALLRQKPNERPFMLSRSTFAGQGRLSAHWLGDNLSKWKDMYESIQGVLQFNMFQIPMVGADVCGFGEDTNEELCNRWMSLGAYLPFYRNHNVKGAKDQEPYLWDSVAEASRTAIYNRYRMLPLWESLFAEAHKTGVPPVRPLFFEFDDPKYKSVDRQFLIGDSLLVTPVLEEGAKSVTGYFPREGGPWRLLPKGQVIETDDNDMATLDAPLGVLPLAFRSGSVAFGHKEPGYTVKETKQGPYFITVQLDQHERATSQYILDDGISVDGPELAVTFTAQSGSLKMSTHGHFAPTSKIAQIHVLSLSTSEKNGLIVELDDVEFEIKPGQKDVELAKW